MILVELTKTGNKRRKKMKFDISAMAHKANTAVGLAAGIFVGVAITLTAAVHIKHCLRDLLPHKKHRKIEVHVFEMGEPCEEKEEPVNECPKAEDNTGSDEQTK